MSDRTKSHPGAARWTPEVERPALVETAGEFSPIRHVTRVLRPSASRISSSESLALLSLETARAGARGEVQSPSSETPLRCSGFERERSGGEGVLERLKDLVASSRRSARRRRSPSETAASRFDASTRGSAKRRLVTAPRACRPSTLPGRASPRTLAPPTLERPRRRNRRSCPRESRRPRDD